MAEQNNQEPANPCSFKSKCKDCGMVAVRDRPSLCLSIACSFYTPCSRCGANKNLNEISGLCKSCEKGNSSVGILKEAISNLQGKLETNLEDATKAYRAVSVTMPGDPPSELQENEKAYYEKRWKDYQGYYRDPAAYVICHYMIIEEINLNFIQSKILQFRGEAQADLEKQKALSITNLKNLKDQLPEKESEEMSDDDKSLGRIYDRWKEEVGHRDVEINGEKISRVFSPEAIALAPALPFSVNPRELLIKLGFNPQESLEAAEKFFSNEECGSTPEQVLEFFGFKLKEKYAKPKGVKNLEEFVEKEEE